MRSHFPKTKNFLLLLVGNLLVTFIQAQTDPKSAAPVHNPKGLLMLMLMIACMMLTAAVYLLYKVKHVMTEAKEKNNKAPDQRFNEYVRNLSSAQIEKILKIKKKQSTTDGTFE